MIISHKQETIIALIESINVCHEEHVLTDEWDISNYPGVNSNKNSDEIFELSQSHLVDKIISHVGLTVSSIIKYKYTP